MNQRLIHDAATTITRAVVDLFRWDCEEQKEEAFFALLPVIARGIEAYETSRQREQHRLAKRRTDDG